MGYTVNKDGSCRLEINGHDISSMPKLVAETICNKYHDRRGKENLPFGYAIAQCQFFGKKIKRAGWNGDGQYVRFENVLAFDDGKIHVDEENAGPATESACFVFHFKNRHTGATGVQVGWLASQADLQAKDWVIIED